jgi:hypothetical protein
MNVEIGAEAALFPEKEYKSGIFVAVCQQNSSPFRDQVPLIPRCYCLYMPAGLHSGGSLVFQTEADPSM